MQSVCFHLYTHSKPGKTICGVRVQGFTLIVTFVDANGSNDWKRATEESWAASAALFLYLGGGKMAMFFFCN